VDVKVEEEVKVEVEEEEVAAVIIFSFVRFVLVRLYCSLVLSCLLAGPAEELSIMTALSCLLQVLQLLQLLV
jgi:hypothetical protein